MIWKTLKSAGEKTNIFWSQFYSFFIGRAGQRPSPTGGQGTEVTTTEQRWVRPLQAKGGKCITTEHETLGSCWTGEDPERQNNAIIIRKDRHLGVQYWNLYSDMIQRTETGFGFNEKTIHSFPGHNNQSAPLVQWNRIQTGQEQTQEERKIKKIPFWFYTSGICLILCNKQKRKAFVRQPTGNLKIKFVIFFHLKWGRVNI